MNKNTQQPGSGDLPPLPDTDVVYEDGKNEWGYADHGSAYSADAMRQYARDAIAASRCAASGARNLKWSEPARANAEISYDHVIAETPFGRIVITWKGWKESDCPTVDEHPVRGFIGHATDDLDDAMRDAELAYFDAIDASVSAAASLPDVAMPEHEIQRIAEYWGDQARKGCVDALQCALREAWKLAAQPAEGSALVARTEQDQAHVMPPFAAPASQHSISLHDSGWLQREKRTTGEPGWLLYDSAGKLVRALNHAECDLVDRSWQDGWMEGMQEATKLLAGEILDAARYRWVRDSANSEGPNYVSMYADDDLDERVDQAMKGWK